MEGRGHTAAQPAAPAHVPAGASSFEQGAQAGSVARSVAGAPVKVQSDVGVEAGRPDMPGIAPPAPRSPVLAFQSVVETVSPLTPPDCPVTGSAGVPCATAVIGRAAIRTAADSAATAIQRL